GPPDRPPRKPAPGGHAAEEARQHRRLRAGSRTEEAAQHAAPEDLLRQRRRAGNQKRDGDENGDRPHFHTSPPSGKMVTVTNFTSPPLGAPSRRGSAAPPRDPAAPS